MIKVIFADIDGVLTDGKVSLDFFGNEIVRYSRYDGLAISKALKRGVKIVLLTGEKKGYTHRRRAKKLGVPIYTDVVDKKEAIKNYCRLHGITKIEEVAFIGDDLPDLGAINFVGNPFVVRDSPLHRKLEENMLYYAFVEVTGCTGGNGCLREVIEKLVTI